MDEKLSPEMRIILAIEAMLYTKGIFTKDDMALTIGAMNCDSHLEQIAMAKDFYAKKKSTIQ